MRGRKTLVYLLTFSIAVILLAGCRVAVKDVKPEDDVQYTAAYGYRDLQALSAEMARRILLTPLAKEQTPPVMLIFGIENRTDEHLDMKLLANAIRNDLLKSGRFQFINEGQRQKLENEMDYQKQGFISPETRIEIGKQVGAKYLLSGQFASITAEELKQVRIKKKELKYYRLTLEITDINTNLIVWTDEQEIVREQAAPFVGW